MTDKLIHETAKAWAIEPTDVRTVAGWVSANVDPCWQGKVFTNLLRKKRREIWQASTTL